MATKSITKDVRITDRALGNRFANALERCSEKRAMNVVIPVMTREMKTDDEIKKLFNKA